MKYQVSLKVKQCHLFSERFEYIVSDILPTGNATAKSKYDMVLKWKRPTTGENVRSFVSFCNFYAQFYQCFKCSVNRYETYMHVVADVVFPTPHGLHVKLPSLRTLSKLLLLHRCLHVTMLLKQLFLKLIGAQLVR